MSDAAGLQQRMRDAFQAAGVQLGTYALPGGQDTPAISVGDPPRGTTVKGLEVIIARNPQRKVTDTFQFTGYIEAWPVRLVNHDHADLEAALNALAQVFWPFDEGPALLLESPDTYEQVTLSITP